MKKIALILALALMLCSCGGTKTESIASENTSVTTTADDLSDEQKSALDEFWATDITTDGGWEDGEYPQLAQTQDESLPRVCLSTSMGDITLVLYPSAAPLAVENFLTHCKDGYYDGLLFHRVMEDFMIQSGDPNGDGTGGESIYETGVFDNEVCDSLRHFNGALAMANAGPNTNGSQFYIVQGNVTVTEDDFDEVMFYWYYNEINSRLYSIPDELYTEELVNSLNVLLNEASTNGVPEEFRERYLPALQAYTEHGGYPYLDYGYTVFGQVIEGMDVVDAIAAVKVQENASGENSSPVEPVTIVSATVISG